VHGQLRRPHGQHVRRHQLRRRDAEELVDDGARRVVCTASGVDKSLFFFPITDRGCVALPNVDISTSAPPMDEVAVACPPACNNNDARGRAIYVGAVADPGGGTTYACSSLPLGRRATADAAVGLMQAVLAPERLSPLSSRTLRPVFVQDDVRTTQFSMATTRPPRPRL
jgi:hypothetical protein